MNYQYILLLDDCPTLILPPNMTQEQAEEVATRWSERDGVSYELMLAPVYERENNL